MKSSVDYKIDYAIMGSNLDPFYLDFWPIVSKVWKEIFNITPVLGLICNEDSDWIQDEYGLIKKFKIIEGVDTGLQSQIIRLYITKELQGNIITSDIDMVPLCKEYFIDQVKYFDKSNIYIMSSDSPEGEKHKEIPICYNVSDSQIFSNMLELDDKWEDFANRLLSMGFGWTTDQRYLWLKIQKFKNENPDKIAFLERLWPDGAYRRIDRLKWNYNEDLVSLGFYIDSHLLRPYKDNKKEIDKLIQLLY